MRNQQVGAARQIIEQDRGDLLADAVARGLLCRDTVDGGGRIWNRPALRANDDVHARVFLTVLVRQDSRELHAMRLILMAGRKFRLREAAPRICRNGTRSEQGRA